MSEADPVGPEGSQNAMILGEMRGQLREVVHGLNNLSQKFDGLTREVVALGALATMVGKLEAMMETMDARVKMLENARSAHSASTSTLKMILNSPLVGWLFLAAVAVWVAIKGNSSL
jgi:hypothetical protein